MDLDDGHSLFRKWATLSLTRSTNCGSSLLSASDWATWRMRCARRAMLDVFWTMPEASQFMTACSVRSVSRRIPSSASHERSQQNYSKTNAQTHYYSPLKLAQCKFPTSYLIIYKFAQLSCILHLFMYNTTIYRWHGWRQLCRWPRQRGHAASRHCPSTASWEVQSAQQMPGCLGSSRQSVPLLRHVESDHQPDGRKAGIMHVTTVTTQRVTVSIDGFTISITSFKWCDF